MHKITVLVITCNTDEDKLLQSYLAASTACIDTHITHRGDSALKSLCSNAYDVFLLDTSNDSQADKSGLELLQLAKAGGCDSPVILITSYASDCLEEAIDAAGGADFIPKCDLSSITLRRSIHYANKYYRRYTELMRRADDVQGKLRELLMKYVKTDVI